MKGIDNIGNTCFINSILQILNNTDNLRQYILSNNYNTSLFEYFNQNKKSLPKNYELYKILLLTFQKIFIALNSDDYEVTKHVKGLCICLQNLAKRGDCLASDISDFSMHNDAEEFLTYILDKIEDYSIDNNFEIHNNTISQKYMNTRYKNKNIIIKSFKLQQITQYKCLSCNNLTKLNYNNYLNKIQLSINKDYIKSLDDALSHYSLTNEMNEYNCEKCSVIGKAKERTLLTILPNYITIQLLRFKNDGNKINKAIDIPLRLNFDKYCYKMKDMNYELSSVVCHIDFSMMSGHYISLVKKNNDWYIQNDDDVKKISEYAAFEYIKNKGYILIYKKI
jgi:ubiquitin C-terminal hydrolase